ncbi:MAG: hypothetical protein BAJATHORv1_10454 [Candidatus Thorarchaeota archaeon]|nr:MAG: hypothetical protein BAJATHORv1_10454 [Candidatus Thorarchaeota archaeon]
MSEDNEHKTVVIDLEETETSRIGELSDLEASEASGVLSVNNVSESNRIWNVRVLLNDSRAKTSYSEDILQAGEIDTGGKWESQYTITIDKPILTLTEVYDTCKTVDTEAPHWAYVHGKDNPVKITIVVKNETDGQMDNIILNKTIPMELTDIKIESTKSGVAEYDEGTRQIVWKDFIIYPNEDSQIIITGTGNVDDVDPKSAGEIVVTYRAEGQQRSGLKPDMTALTEFLSGIDTAETQPNQWEVTLECGNESDLMVRLDEAAVILTPEDGGEERRMIDEKPEAKLAPGEEWSSSFQVESKSPPQCTPEVTYTPMRVITKRVLGTVEKVPQTMPVYKIDYSKTFDPPEVNSFDKTPVEVEIEVKNAGTARLNEVTIIDNLPDDVMPPKAEHVSIWIRGEEYTGEYELVIDPEDQNPEVPHQITIHIKGLKDSVGEVQPGETVKVNYAIMAWRNRPEKEYPSPTHCKANIFPPGLEAEIASPEDGHKLGIVYKKRRISVKKAINKGANPGEYTVVLIVENKGEVTVENVEVADWIPMGFEFVSVDPAEEAPELSNVADGTNMTWKWTRMNPGDKTKLRVNVQGEGEYERREPNVTSD